MQLCSVLSDKSSVKFILELRLILKIKLPVETYLALSSAFLSKADPSKSNDWVVVLTICQAGRPSDIRVFSTFDFRAS